MIRRRFLFPSISRIRATSTWSSIDYFMLGGLVYIGICMGAVALEGLPALNNEVLHGGTSYNQIDIILILYV
jgi:hypothetical protein